MANLLVFQDQRRAGRMGQTSAEKLKQTGSTEKERMPSAPQSELLASTPKPPFPKGKGTEPSVQINRSCDGRKSNERESHVGEKDEGHSGSTEKKELAAK